jgi:hypothetical protein
MEGPFWEVAAFMAAIGGDGDLEGEEEEVEEREGGVCLGLPVLGASGQPTATAGRERLRFMDVRRETEYLRVPSTAEESADNRLPDVEGQ